MSPVSTGAAVGSDLATRRSWMDRGTRLVRGAVDGLDDAAFDAETALTGWTRRHLVAHVAANADALGNLVHWATTGEETPMYASATQRGDDIEAGSRRPVAELRDWLAASADALDRGLDGLTDAQWVATVRTAQGRTVPASEIPWMRAREVLIHAVDLGTGLGFADLPADFLAALVRDVVGKRSGSGTGPALRVTITDSSIADGGIADGSEQGAEPIEVAGEGDPIEVSGPLVDVAAWLTGRFDPERSGLTTASGTALPTLPPWL